MTYASNTALIELKTWLFVHFFSDHFLLTLVLYTSFLSTRLTLIPTKFVAPALMQGDLTICHSTVGSAQNVKNINVLNGSHICPYIVLTAFSRRACSVTTTSLHRPRRSHGAHSRDLVLSTKYQVFRLEGRGFKPHRERLRFAASSRVETVIRLRSIEVWTDAPKSASQRNGVVIRLNKCRKRRQCKQTNK